MSFEEMNPTELQYALIYWILYSTTAVSLILLFYQILICFVVRCTILFVNRSKLVVIRSEMNTKFPNFEKNALFWFYPFSVSLMCETNTKAIRKQKEALLKPACRNFRHSINRRNPKELIKLVYQLDLSR